MEDGSNRGERVSNASSLSSEGIDTAIRNRKRGMVLPFEPHSITFNEISYSVDMPQVNRFC